MKSSIYTEVILWFKYSNSVKLLLSKVLHTNFNPYFHILQRKSQLTRCRLTFPSLPLRVGGSSALEASLYSAPVQLQAQLNLLFHPPTHPHSQVTRISTFLSTTTNFLLFWFNSSERRDHVKWTLSNSQIFQNNSGFFLLSIICFWRQGLSTQYWL